MTENMRQASSDTMVEVGEEDPSLAVLVGEVGHGILQPFARAHPCRYNNVGICEPTIVGMAAGLSKVGLTSVVHTIAPFLIERSYEQIKLDFGYQHLGVNLISVRGTFGYSQLGCSHHCDSGVSIIFHIEGSVVLLPGSAAEFRSLFRQTYDNRCINCCRLSENPQGADGLVGAARVGETARVRSGGDVTEAVAGSQLRNAIEAARALADSGVGVDLVSSRPSSRSTRTP